MATDNLNALYFQRPYLLSNTFRVIHSLSDTYGTYLWVDANKSAGLTIQLFVQWYQQILPNATAQKTGHLHKCIAQEAVDKVYILEQWNIQVAQLSPRDRAMRRVNWNLANCHATVQKLLIRQVLTKLVVWSWRFCRRQCVIEMCTQPRRDRLGSHCLRCHKQTDDGRVVYITCIPTTCCGEIF